MSTKYTAGGPWMDEHNVALTRAIVHLVMSNRSTLYADPALASVNNNGGDRVNKKTQQLLRKLTDGIPDGEGMIKESVSKAKGGKQGQGSPSKGRGKKSDGGPQVTPRKRKVKEEEEDSDEDEGQ